MSLPPIDIGAVAKKQKREDSENDATSSLAMKRRQNSASRRAKYGKAGVKTIGISKPQPPQDLIPDEPDSDNFLDDGKSSLRLKLENEDAISMLSYRSRYSFQRSKTRN